MEEMQAFNTSLLMNSRIGATEAISGLNSGIIERKMRSTTPQQRVSRIRIACVQNKIRGSKIAGVDIQKARIVLYDSVSDGSIWIQYSCNHHDSTVGQLS